MRVRIRSDRDAYNWLFEQEEAGGAGATAPDPLTAEKIQKLWQMPYAQFVEELKKVATDPKLHAFLAVGKKDGDPTDEGVKVAPMTIAGSQLSPTQSEIDLSNSVAFSFKNPALIAKFYGGGAWKGGDPIITAGGKWVIDGHHRWSQAMVFNPEIVLDCINIDIADPEMALKMTQAAIAVTKKNVPTQAVKEGMNVYKMSFDDIINKFGSVLLLGNQVLQQLKGKLEVTATPEEIAKAKAIAVKIGPSALQMATEPDRAQMDVEQGDMSGGAAGPETNYGGISVGGDTGGAIGGGYLREAKVGEASPADETQTWGEAAGSLAHNIKTLPPAGKFPRPIMPQTGTGDGGPGPAGLSTALQSGDINYKPGFDVSGAGKGEKGAATESLNEHRIRRIHLPGIHRSRS